MPEGDTLRRLADRITLTFAGAAIERTAVRDPRLVGVDLAGCTLVDADAYGKHLFVRFDDGRSLHAHLLMTGGFSVGPVSREPEWKRRIELWLDRGRLTGESVPVLGMLATRDEHDITDHLGPDLCAPAGAPDPTELARRLVREPGVGLTAAMLDQRHVAGFGNIYVNDVPFIVGVNPFQPVGSVDGLADAVAIGTAQIPVNAARGPQNTTGRRLSTNDRWVHGRGRSRCAVCGSRLDHRDERSTAWRRSVTWCPSCQPLVDGRCPVDLDRARRLLALHPAVREPVFPGR